MPTQTDLPAHTDVSILQSYLLQPAALNVILPFSQFVLLFPKTHQGRGEGSRPHPQIKALYRDLQFLRNVDLEVIRENILDECRRGEKTKVEMLRQLNADKFSRSDSRNASLKGEVAQKKQADQRTLPYDSLNDPRESQFDEVLFGTVGNLPKSSGDKYHSLKSLLLEMERACDDIALEAEMAEAECKQILVDVSDTVGGLSDLRYGKFGKKGASAGVEDEVIRGLENLEKACKQGMARSG